VDGTELQIHDAKSVFGRRNIQEWKVYDAPETNAYGISTAALQYANRDGMPEQHTPGASAYEADTGMLNSSNRNHTSDLAHATGTQSNKSSLSALYQTYADSTRGRHNRPIGIFSTYQETANALEELRQANFPMKRVSVIVRDAYYMTRGHYLVLVRGTGAEIRNAQMILRRRGIIEQNMAGSYGKGMLMFTVNNLASLSSPKAWKIRWSTLQVAY
jgi:hypothetical protein